MIARARGKRWLPQKKKRHIGSGADGGAVDKVGLQLITIAQELEHNSCVGAPTSEPGTRRHPLFQMDAQMQGRRHLGTHKLENLIESVVFKGTALGGALKLFACLARQVVLGMDFEGKAAAGFCKLQGDCVCEGNGRKNALNVVVAVEAPAQDPQTYVDLGRALELHLLTQFFLYKLNVFLGFWIKLLDFKLALIGLFVPGCGVKKPGARSRFQFYNFSHDRGKLAGACTESSGHLPGGIKPRTPMTQRPAPWEKSFSDCRGPGQAHRPHMKPILFFLAILVAATPLLAQDAPKPAPGECKDHSAMMQERKARDLRLDQLLQAMNKAAAQKKVDLMADILRELLAERKKTHEHMACMMEMKKDMMGPKKDGPQGEREGACKDRCDKMKNEKRTDTRPKEDPAKKDDKAKKTDDHKAHH